MRSLVVAAICCFIFRFTDADVKTWTKNTNYDDPANWNGGGIVCSNDRKVFPKDLVVSIFVQKNESLQELVLSDNMVLSIGEGVVLSFSTQMFSNDNVVVSNPSVDSRQTSSVRQQTTSATPSCTREGRVVEFTAKPSPWYNPESWSTQQEASNDSKRFMLDTESVPCNQDRVVFPSKDTFLVDMERADVMAAAMLIHNEEFTTQAAFENYWTGDVARYEFVNKPRNAPVITGLPCGDDRTCACMDRYSDTVKNLVCKYKTCDKPETLLCSNPISPKFGQCCQLCGSRLTVLTTASESTSLNYELHRQMVAGLKDYGSVKYSLGPIVENSMEIILIDTSGKGDSSNQAVCDLREFLLVNETAQYFKISGIHFERSDGVDNCNRQPGTTLPVLTKTPKWDSIIVGGSLAFAILCVLVVCLGVYFYRKRYTGNLKNDMELANVGNRTSQGFDNPVYDTPLPFEDSFTVTYDTSGDQVNGFENALYSPGNDSGVSVHSEEKKTPLEDPYAPVVKKGKKKQTANGKKQKEAKIAGFDNPVYSLRDGSDDGKVSMESVPLDEDDSQLPAYVEHDGTDEDDATNGYANPIATGLSEEMMAPSLPKKVPIGTLQANEGFDNPLFGEARNAGGEEVDGDLGAVTVHVSEPTKKKKKEKKQKSKNGGSTVGKGQGFDNPLYGQEREQQDFYQPENPGEDDSNLPADD